MEKPLQQYPLSHELDLQHLAINLKCPDDFEKVSRVTQTVLHTLRDYLNLEESIRLLRLLPLPLKAMFIENWRVGFGKQPPFGTKSFIHDVQVSAGRIAFYDFPNEETTDASIRTVFQFVEKQVLEKKRAHFRTIIPPPLRRFLADAPAFQAALS